MKKLLFTLCLLLLLTGCSKDSSVNSIEYSAGEKSSLDEVNEIMHGHLAKPAAMGVTDEKFSVVDMEGLGLVGQYTFTINDNEFTVRFSDTIVKEDISSVYIDGEPAFSDDLNDVRASGDGLQLARWFTVDGQYVLIASASIDADIFNSALNELASLSVPESNN